MSTFERRLIGFVQEMDFAIASAALVIDPPGEEAVVAMVGNTPKGYEDAQRDQADVQRDPVIKRLKTLSVPFIYNQDLYVHEGAADLWDRQAPFGFRTGIAVALHLPGHKHFLLGVDRETDLPKEDEKLTRMLADLQFLAVHAQDAAQRLLSPTPVGMTDIPRLTPRELDVLRLTRDGKSAWVAGKILSVSENTINYHLQNIHRKMNTSSKHQAVLRAMSLGLI